MSKGNFRQPNSRRDDDDLNDFMANLINGQSSGDNKPKNHGRVFIKHRQKNSNKQFDQPAPREQSSYRQSYPETKPQKQPKTPKPKRQFKLKKGVKKTLVTIPLVLLVIVGGYFLWRGPISSFLQPDSPFSQEQKDTMRVPLYYPTKLPGSFKIDSSTITKPEDGVIVYALTDDSSKRINITLQRQTSTLNLDPLYAILTDTKEIDTNFGKVKIGTSAENFEIANILTGQTWVIINSTKGTIDESDMKSLINSLKF